MKILDAIELYIKIFLLLTYSVIIICYGYLTVAFFIAIVRTKYLNICEVIFPDSIAQSAIPVILFTLLIMHIQYNRKYILYFPIFQLAILSFLLLESRHSA
ncbi:MAG: hypothetical protein R8L53_08940 [Mariprofundales bacterium]